LPSESDIRKGHKGNEHKQKTCKPKGKKNVQWAPAEKDQHQKTARRPHSSHGTKETKIRGERGGKGTVTFGS